jgi:hypothetical protein
MNPNAFEVLTKTTTHTLENIPASQMKDGDVIVSESKSKKGNSLYTVTRTTTFEYFGAKIAA